MKCDKCGKSYPSSEFFKLDSICNKCYEKLNPEEKASPDTKKISTGKERSFIGLILLSIITFGLYYLYWLYINLAEVKKALTVIKKSNVLSTAQILLIIKIVLWIAAILTSAALVATRTFDEGGRFDQPVFMYLIAYSERFVSIIFYYFFTRSISVAQRSFKLDPFSTELIFAFYGFYWLADFITSILIIGMPVSSFLNYGQMLNTLSPFLFLSLLGSLSVLYYLFRMQKEINWIWRKVS